MALGLKVSSYIDARKRQGPLKDSDVNYIQSILDLDIVKNFTNPDNPDGDVWEEVVEGLKS